MPSPPGRSCAAAYPLCRLLRCLAVGGTITKRAAVLSEPWTAWRVEGRFGRAQAMRKTIATRTATSAQHAPSPPTSRGRVAASSEKVAQARRRCAADLRARLAAGGGARSGRETLSCGAASPPCPTRSARRSRSVSPLPTIRDYVRYTSRHVWKRSSAKRTPKPCPTGPVGHGERIRIAELPWFPAGSPISSISVTPVTKFLETAGSDDSSVIRMC